MKAYFAWKQLVKNIWKEEDCGHGFVYLLVGYISVKKAQNVGKVASFGLMLTLSLLLFGEIEKGKLYILKKVGLSTFKEIL